MEEVSVRAHEYVLVVSPAERLYRPLFVEADLAGLGSADSGLARQASPGSVVLRSVCGAADSVAESAAWGCGAAAGDGVPDLARPLDEDVHSHDGRGTAGVR